jgi:tetratricopeptide (TPR) repeat protein
VGGESYMGLDSDVFTQEPKVLKQNTIDQLGMYAHESKRIRKAIKHIQKSLDEDKKKKKEKNKLWEDDYHLTKKGKKVFNEEKKGAHELMKILKNDDVDPSVKSAAKEAIDFLVAADRALAQKAIDEATDASGDPKKIDKALKEMEKAQEEIDKEKYDKAIDHYKKAWEHAMKAMKKVVEDDPDEYL